MKEHKIKRWKWLPSWFPYNTIMIILTMYEGYTTFFKVNGKLRDLK